MSENQIKEILEEAAPAAPRFDGMSGRVRTIQRRRRAVTRGAVAVTAVAAVVALATFVPGALRSNETPLPAEPVTSAPPTPPSDLELGDASVVPSVCADAEGAVTSLMNLPDARIQEGATRLWLCPDFTYLSEWNPPADDVSWGLGDPPRIAGPFEPLVTGIDALVASVNDAPLLPYDPAGSCSLAPGAQPEQDGFTAFWVVLDYPDGERRWVSGGTLSCLPVMTDGNQGRGDSKAFFDGILSLYRQQRATYQYAYGGDVVECPGGVSLFSPTLDQITRGVVCGLKPDTWNSSPHREDRVRRDLPAELVGQLAGDVSKNSVRVPDDELATTWPLLFNQSIVLSDRFGDPITLFRSGDGPFFYRGQGGERFSWTPSSELAGQLAPYFEGMRTKPFQRPDEIPADCRSNNTLDAGDPFGAPVRAVLCITDRTGETSAEPMPEPLWTELLAALRSGTAALLDFSYRPEAKTENLSVFDAQGRTFTIAVYDDGSLGWTLPGQEVGPWYVLEAPPQDVTDWLVAHLPLR